MSHFFIADALRNMKQVLPYDVSGFVLKNIQITNMFYA